MVITKKEKIFDVLLHRILYMQYSPGEILNETTLAEEFGTSRGPLREVLKQLEWKKLVVTMPRLGTQVTEIDFQKIIQTFQIRFDIEALAARLACENATQAAIDRIGRLIDTLSRGFENGHHTPDISFIQVDFKFRDILYEAAQNPILREMSDYLYHITLRINLLAYQKGDFERCRPLFLEEMQAFQEAFTNRDVAAAAKIRQAYMKAYLVGVKSLF
ncbi:MAG: GntR family transcriptional regulator [Desulfosarcinaceae bacterium]|nr:GntR family transcriptional regulator [Desulfosarcinaceae bacterium]